MHCHATVTVPVKSIPRLMWHPLHLRYCSSQEKILAQSGVLLAAKKPYHVDVIAYGVITDSLLSWTRIVRVLDTRLLHSNVEAWESHFCFVRFQGNFSKLYIFGLKYITIPLVMWGHYFILRCAFRSSWEFKDWDHNILDYLARQKEFCWLNKNKWEVISLEFRKYFWSKGG